MLGALVFLLSIYFYFSPQRYIAVFLLFFLLTGGFQLIPLNYLIASKMGITKTYDWVLLFTAAIALLKPQIFLELAAWRNFKVMWLYGLVLVILLFYSIFIRDVEVSVSVRVFRSFIYLVTVFLFVPLSLPELEKVFKLIIYATSIAAVVYCLQLAVHKELLNRVTSDEVGLNDNGLFERYYNLPVFIYPVVFFLFFSRNAFSLPGRIILLFSNCLAILFSQHRNLVISILICYLLFLLLNHRLKLMNALLFCILGAGVVLGADYVWGNRFSKGLEDLSQASLNVVSTNFYEVKVNDLSTTEFRQLLLAERLNYILKDQTSSLLGVGLITDDSKKALALNFNVGVTDEYGNVTQVASGDIAWSVLLLQMGIVGSLMFLLFHVSLLIKFFLQRKHAFMQVGLLYIICLIFTSLYSNMIMLPYVTSLVMLFAAYYSNLFNRVS
jgi:hypothetical protein